jgi:hypothetical protein
MELSTESTKLTKNRPYPIGVRAALGARTEKSKGPKPQMDTDRHRFLRLPHQATPIVRIHIPRAFYLCVSVSICGFTSSSWPYCYRVLSRLVGLCRAVFFVANPLLLLGRLPSKAQRTSAGLLLKLFS